MAGLFRLLLYIKGGRASQSSLRTELAATSIRHIVNSHPDSAAVFTKYTSPDLMTVYIDFEMSTEGHGILVTKF